MGVVGTFPVAAHSPTRSCTGILDANADRHNPNFIRSGYLIGTRPRKRPHVMGHDEYLYHVVKEQAPEEARSDRYHSSTQHIAKVSTTI